MLRTRRGCITPPPLPPPEPHLEMWAPASRTRAAAAFLASSCADLTYTRQPPMRVARDAHSTGSMKPSTNCRRASKEGRQAQKACLRPSAYSCRQKWIRIGQWHSAALPPSLHNSQIATCSLRSSTFAA